MREYSETFGCVSGHVLADWELIQVRGWYFEVAQASAASRWAEVERAQPPEKFGRF